MFVVNNALYKEIFDKMKRREQRKIKVCPVCYGDVIFIYDIYTSDIIRSLRDNRLIFMVFGNARAVVDYGV